MGYLVNEKEVPTPICDASHEPTGVPPIAEILTNVRNQNDSLHALLSKIFLAVFGKEPLHMEGKSPENMIEQALLLTEQNKINLEITHAILDQLFGGRR